MAGPILTAELLSVGTELTVGETRDTNAGDLARSLTGEGVRVLRISALPDELEALAAAVADGLARADLVVSTGGLGPTPDDLTREAIAAAVGETPLVDPGLEAWLRRLWARRKIPFPEINLKQAWLIPPARPLPNPHGTAPGWWVERPDGRLVVALPGPPREMRPMWAEEVLPRLRQRGLGEAQAVRTLRLAGIGESQVADLLGPEVLGAANPRVATYARAEAVDVRISAVAADRPSAAALVEATEAAVLERLGRWVWARGTTSWAEAIGEALGIRGWTLATTEVGTGGSFVALLGALPAIRLGEVRADGGATREGDLDADAARVREISGADVGLALEVVDRGEDTAVEVAVLTPAGVHHERRLAFLGGPQGRQRAALAAADILLRHLRHPEAPR